ncbi:sensor histidine kinase [Glycomyces scopariae]|uniref:Anti-sigma regulatory factor (Ser/Thr protein kinase) n=1 Tax=Glycomyces sambucus TaxID=380244 RepID=A0A1G9HYT2_9ACTN|nr:anti-sigma factor RsbA family regulatory protein [Glycomyces sambucus]SDL17824.1 Anti-sigma regulatory factor (Ser/Thr protein kinase) [Glycomyces sambucus]
MTTGTAHGEPGVQDGFEHPALFYSGSDEYLAGTVPFIESALRAGEPVAAAVPGHNLEALRRALGTDAERVEFVDMADAGANPARIIPGVLRSFIDAHKGTRVRIIGEPIWPGRSELEYPACVQHEALLNLAFTGRPVTKLCPYDTQGLSERAIADAKATHPLLIDSTGRHPSDEYDPDGILDAYNRPLDPAPRRAVERSADRHTLDNARWFATSYGRAAGMSSMQLIDLEIVITELLTNSISHGGGEGLFRIWAEDAQLVCEVSDAGHITDPLAGRMPTDDSQFHGRGLVLVNQIVDLLLVHTSPRGTTVRFYLRLPTT